MKFLKALIFTVMLSNPFIALASGGDNPVPGIDVIIKSASIKQIKVTFNSRELAAVNKLKGKEKPTLIAKIAANKVTSKLPKYKVKGGWNKAFKNGLLKTWCAKCNGGTTSMTVKGNGGQDRLEESFNISIKLAKGNISAKPSITKIKAKAAIKSTIKKK